MNEQISKLANQVGFDVDNTGKFGNYSEMIRVEKFAELILKECLDQLFVSDPNEDYDKGIAWSKAQIKQHFGVEE